MGIKVLIADDHTLMREGLRSILEREDGVEIIGEASSGLEVLELCLDAVPDIVVMDVAMEDLNGVEATRRLRERHASVRVIALASHNDSRLMAQMLRAGASGYVLKENAYTELRPALDAVSRGSSYLCPGVTAKAAEIIQDTEAPRGSAWDVLGDREREVLQLLAEGLTSAEVAEKLHIALNTVETHRRNIMRKLDLHNVVELTRYAIREGLTRVED
ncbi:response regulator [Lentisalinibacter salinarum]|uniref:response regulator n=1 Tax=Lentisalinibacter salinarum TaxID=2992239 RepID=UPI003869A549